jgi:hypothetical protein
MTAAPRLIEPELATFLEGDCAQYIGTVAPDGMPSAGRGWGLRVPGPGPRIRLLAGADAETVANTAVAGARIGLCTTDLETLRSVQLKGAVVGVEAPDAADLAVHAAYRTEFEDAVRRTAGTTPMDAVWPAALVAITIDVDALFDQTPGPNAGVRLGGGS